MEYPKMLFRDGVVGKDRVIVNSLDEEKAQAEAGYFDPIHADKVAAHKAEAERAAEEQKRIDAQRAAAAAKEPGKTDAPKEGEGQKPNASEKVQGATEAKAK